MVGEPLRYALVLKFKATNNKARYEELITDDREDTYQTIPRGMENTRKRIQSHKA